MKHNLLSEKLLNKCLVITFGYVRDLADDSMPPDLLLLGANTPFKALSHPAVVEQLAYIADLSSVTRTKLPSVCGSCGFTMMKAISEQLPWI
jgi:hypothetical protein